MKNSCDGYDLEKWFCVSYLKSEVAKNHPVLPAGPLPCPASLEGFVLVAVAFRTKPQKQAMLVNLATAQHHGDQ